MVMRILYFAEEPCQSVSFWRGMGLFTELVRAHPGEYEVVQVRDGEVHWWDIARADVVWMTRPTSPQFEPMFSMAEDHGVTVVVDWDDLFMDIPVGNPVRNRIAGERLKMTAMYVNRATLATVSTEQLKASFEKRGLAVPMHVLPNALPDRYVWKKQGPPTKTVLWRGSSTHDGDIDEVGDDIVALAEEFGDWRWVFAGWDPWRITKRLRRGSWVTFDPQPMAHYHATVVGLCPSIIMSPLADNEFNRCKSDIGRLEAALAGGAYVSGSGSGFVSALRAALERAPDESRALALQDRGVIDDSKRIRHVIPTLKSILESAVNHA